MSASTAVAPSARSWRDIPQNIAPRAMSATGRRRMAMATIKSVLLLTVALVAAFAGYEIWQTWQSDPTKVTAPVKSSPLKQIVLRTNGVLDQPWVEATLALPKAIDLMELDLHALRDKLLAGGQVRTAVLARKFPDTLTITLDERSPIAQLRTGSGGGEFTDYLVARDGTVFLGACYDQQLVSALPYLDLATTRLVRTRTGFQPLTGMETIADLLNTARGNVPNHYRNWKVVSLARFYTDGDIIVRSKDVPEIIFGTRENFYKQVAYLDFILEQAQARPERPLKTVNLAVGGTQVPVAFEPVAETPERQNALHAPGRSAATVQSLRAAPRRPSVISHRQRSTSHRDF